MSLQISIDGGAFHDVAVTRGENDACVWIGGRMHRATLYEVGRRYEVSLDDRTEEIWVVVDRDTVHIHAFGRSWTAQVAGADERALQDADRADVATAPMPGTLIAVEVEAGQQVTTGQQLVVIESMKMQTEIVAWRDGVVERVHLQVGDTFDRGASLVELALDEEQVA
jgi:biotin carboxyl carrier protein